MESKKIIIKPLVSEKSIAKANEENKYTFIVSRLANKIEIKKEVESTFNVTVLDIRTINYLGKDVRFGKNRIPGKRQDYKKAILKLKKGDKIPFFDIK